MKNIVFNLLLFGLILFFSGCKDEEMTMKPFSDIMYTTSAGNTNSALNGVIMVNKNSYMTFMDLSQGAVIHKWSIAGQHGICFLSEGFSPNAKDSLDRMSHLISDTISDQKTVNLLFKKEGVYTLTLKNSFRDSVAYMTNLAKYDVESAMWVFTKVFTIKVHGPLTPVVSILKNGTENIPFTNDTIFLAKGDSLIYNESSKGYPTSITWNINGGTPSKGTFSTFKTKFNTPGIYNSSMALSRTSEIWILTNSYLNVKLPVLKVQ